MEQETELLDDDYVVKTKIILFTAFTINNNFVGVFRGRKAMQRAMNVYDKKTNYNKILDAVNGCNIGEFVMIGKFKVYKSFCNIINPKLALDL